MNVYTNWICILFFGMILFENVVFDIEPLVKFTVLFGSVTLMIVQIIWMVSMYNYRKKDMNSYVMVIYYDLDFQMIASGMDKGEHTATLESVVISIADSAIMSRFDATINLKSLGDLKDSKTRGKAEMVSLKDFAGLRSDNEIELRKFSNYLKENEELYKDLHVLTDDGYTTYFWTTSLLVSVLGEQPLDYYRNGVSRRVYNAEDYFRGYNKIPMASQESSKEIVFNDHFVDILHIKEDENEVSITSGKRAAFLAKLYNHMLHLGIDA